MRWIVLLALVAACNGKTLGVETDGLDTDDLGTSDVGTDPDTDTEPDTTPVTDVTRAQPVGAGAVQISSPGFSLDVTVGTPVHARTLSSENYRLTVGVVAPNR